MTRAALLIAAAVACLTAGCGHAAERPPNLPAAGAVRLATSSHVITIVLENKEEGQVLGSHDAPYLNRLAGEGGVATRSYGVSHPSLPNYLALTSGSTHGITSDCTACSVNAPNVVDQLERATLSWKAYMEDLPRPCFLGAFSGEYAKKHNPFAYYDDVAGDRARCRRMVPLSRLGRDLRRGRLPTYTFIAPNLCHDMHDCSVAVGDRFLSQLVPPLLRSVGPHGFVIVTFDEGASNAGCCGGSAGGRIATIVAGPDVRRGARMTRPIDHYGVLRTVEDALGLQRLGAARDARHGSLRPLFSRPPRITG